NVDGAKLINVAFTHIEMDVQGVPADDGDRGHGIDPHIAPIHVKTQDIAAVTIAVQVLLKLLAIERIAPFQPECGRQYLVRVDRVALPVDVAYVIAIPLIDGELDHHTGIVAILDVHRIVHDSR